jgi:hypothetical protein
MLFYCSIQFSFCYKGKVYCNKNHVKTQLFAIALVRNMLCLGINRVVIQALKDLPFSRSTVLSPAAGEKN